jgi:hypothetical protein
VPSTAAVSRFVSLVETGAFVQAIEEFYAPDARTRENHLDPLVGREVLIANERKVLASTKSVTAKLVGPMFVEGDLVVLRWHFVFETTDGKVKRLEELTYQRWQEERIQEEQFFYDPAQMKACLS